MSETIGKSGDILAIMPGVVLPEGVTEDYLREGMVDARKVLGDIGKVSVFVGETVSFEGRQVAGKSFILPGGSGIAEVSVQGAHLLASRVLQNNYGH